MTAHADSKEAESTVKAFTPMVKTTRLVSVDGLGLEKRIPRQLPGLMHPKIIEELLGNPPTSETQEIPQNKAVEG